ncbi:hypothetical protein PIB30_101616, partial [Stylosanthes scabra]|nr:hypothetical protein [Stylosanthes scabra]
TEINNLKKEIKDIGENQDNHQLIISQLMQGEESDDDESEPSESHENKNSNDNEGKEILILIN